jgi:hypothetical protein
LCAVCAMLAAPASGCVSKPTMRLNHAEISGVRLSAYPPTAGILMTVVVDVKNPNSYDVAVRAMRGQVLMASKYLLPIDFRPGGDGVWLAAKSTTSVRVPVAVPLQIAVAVLGESAMSTEISYRVKGRADVTASRTFQLERDDYAVDEQGTISRQQIAAVIPNSL